MHRIFLAALAAAALLPLQSRAVPNVEDFDLRSAGDLVELCAVPDTDPMVETARGFCYGFLSGVNHYHRAVNAGPKGKPLYCLPESGLNRADAARMYVDWSRKNPQHMKEAPVDNLMRFAVATWPCKQAKR
ncbi:MAG: Rap1a/Tai family immunity protein [Bdellovibrio bacteriovorus]